MLGMHFKRFLACSTLSLVLFSFFGERGMLAELETPYVTRAEAAMVLLLSRVPNVGDARNYGRFFDVLEGSWYEKYVIMAERYGILSAVPGTQLLRPNTPINRAQFLKMLTLTFGLQENLPHLYRDVYPASWYAKYTGAAKHYRLFGEEPEPWRLQPEKPMTHDEAATAIQRLLDIETSVGLVMRQRRVAGQRDPFRLNLHLVISNTEERVTVVRRTPPPRRTVKPPAPPEYTFARNIPLLRQEMLGMINAERVNKSLAPLRWNSTLETSAQGYAATMAERGFFGHVSPEGQPLKQRIEDAGYFDPFFTSTCLPTTEPGTTPLACVRRYILGENIARGQKTVREVMDAWLASPSHRRAILHPDFSEVGVGIVAGLWVQHFGGHE